MRAKNEEGNSAWCEAVKYTTQADVPKAPLKLKSKVAQVQPLSIKASWGKNLKQSNKGNLKIII